MVTFIAEENGFIIEADDKKLWVSYDESKGNHEGIMKFCKEQGGGDETVENLRFIAKHSGAINKELKKLGKELILGWYWSNEVTWLRDECAFVVNMCNGNVDYVYRYGTYEARAVSIL